jgi:hypothetical protein
MATPQGNDTVYVAGLPDVVTEKDIAAHFGSIGTLKQDKKRRCHRIWLYRDRDTGLPKGDATVSYADPHAAEAAVSWFNNTEFMGSTLAVSLAERKGGGDSLNLPASHYADPLGRDADSGNAHPTPNPPVTAASSDVPVGGGGNTPAGVGGAQPKPKTTRDGDWPCPNPACGNTNFAFRGKCNRCGTSRPGGDDSAAGNKPPASNPKPKELRNGDWACPDPSCGNVNFAYRGQCNRCGSQRPPGAKGMQGVGGRDGGKPSIFGPDDWTCSNCFNVNWARRNKCNECGTGKEGKAVEKREGRGGGHKEIDDEDEREETARRRRENEEREIYDDFGNLKKQFRASAGRGGADRDYDRGGRDGGRDRDRERDHPYRRDDRDRDRDRRRDRSRSRDRRDGRDRRDRGRRSRSRSRSPRREKDGGNKNDSLKTDWRGEPIKSASADLKTDWRGNPIKSTRY